MIDLASIFINLSQSLAPVQKLLAGLGYVTGIAFMLVALLKFYKIGDARAMGHSQEKFFVPTTYLLLGVGLIYLPSALDVLANTAFGSTNVLAYSYAGQLDLVSAVKFLIQTAGMLWFVRGSVLLAHASEPGVQEGPKGLAFIAAGILALNVENTIDMIQYTLDQFFATMSAIKTNMPG